MSVTWRSLSRNRSTDQIFSPSSRRNSGERVRFCLFSPFLSIRLGLRVFGERTKKTRQIFRLHEPVDNVISPHVAGQERDHLEVLRSGIFGNADQKNEPDQHLANGYPLRPSYPPHHQQQHPIGSPTPKPSPPP